MYHVIYRYRGSNAVIPYNRAEDASRLCELLAAMGNRHVRLERISGNVAETLLEISGLSSRELVKRALCRAYRMHDDMAALSDHETMRGVVSAILGVTP